MKEIALVLGISVRTVETHFETIKHKLGCCNKSQLIEKAIDSGFLFHIPANFLGINIASDLLSGNISNAKMPRKRQQCSDAGVSMDT